MRCKVQKFHNYRIIIVYRYIAHMVLGRDLLDNTLNLVPSLIPLHKDIKEDSPEYRVLESK